MVSLGPSELMPINHNSVGFISKHWGVYKHGHYWQRKFWKSIFWEDNLYLIMVFLQVNARCQFKVGIIILGEGLVPKKWRAITWINDNPILWYKCISAVLTHWGQVMHICVSKLNIIGLDNGLSPLSEPMMLYCQLDPEEHISMEFYLKFKIFH